MSLAKTRNKIAVAFGAATLGVAFAAGAWACTNLATLNLGSGSGGAGQAVAVNGSSFATAKAGVAASPVVLHWNGVNGPVLATVNPDNAGNLSANFTVPQTQPGYYVIVATQQDAKGVDSYGTPARASFQVLGPGGHAVSPQAATQSGGAASSSPSSTGIIALTAGLGVLGLALFGAGSVAFLRQARRREVPVTAPTKR